MRDPQVGRAGQSPWRCWGICPCSRARTSDSRYRRCPPSVRMALSLPALAHRVTVFGSTRNIDATSAGVSSGSGSCVRDAIGHSSTWLYKRLPGSRRLAHVYGPASPACPTWTERLTLPGWTDDECPIYRILQCQIMSYLDLLSPCVVGQIRG